MGKHVTIDLKGCHPVILERVETLDEFLLEAIKECGMKAMMRPQHVKFQPQGYSGFCILAESHISYHTYPEKQEIFIDLYSCKDFNTQRLINLSMFSFLASECKSQVINRD